MKKTIIIITLMLSMLAGSVISGQLDETNGIMTNITNSNHIRQPSRIYAMLQNNNLIYLGGGEALQFSVYNKTDNFIYNMSMTSGNWLSDLLYINDMEFDQYGNIYTAGDTSGRFGLFNLTDRTWYNLTNPQFLGTNINSLAIDTNTQNVYMGHSNGQFGYYDPNDGTIHNLSMVDTDNWIGTSSFLSMIFIADENSIYMGMGTKFGFYNITSNISTNLSMRDTGGWATGGVNDMSYDSENHLIYTILSNGRYGYYNLSDGIWSDLSSTDTGNWIATTALNAVAVTKKGNVFIAGSAGKFGIYIPLTGITYDLRATDVNNFMGTYTLISMLYDRNNNDVYIGTEGSTILGKYNWLDTFFPEGNAVIDIASGTYAVNQTLTASGVDGATGWEFWQNLSIVQNTSSNVYVTQWSNKGIFEIYAVPYNGTYYATPSANYLYDYQPLCNPSWSCDGYASCLTNDTQACNSVTDLNLCGEGYTGDYSEFSAQACDFCTPSWSCIGYDTCLSNSTQYCNSVNDTNTCSEAYAGDYSEFAGQVCTYIPPPPPPEKLGFVDSWAQYGTGNNPNRLIAIIVTIGVVWLGATLFIRNARLKK